MEITIASSVTGVIPFMNDTSGFHCEQVFGTDYGRSVALKFSVLACYLVVFLVALVQYFRIAHKDPVKEMTPQKLFHILLCSVNCARLVLLPIPYESFESVNLFGIFVLHTFPDVMYFSSYLLLFFYWAAVYHRAVELYSRRFQFRVLLYYCIINALAYASMFGVAAYVYKTVGPKDFDDLTEISSIYVSCLSGTVVIIALFYGLALYRKLSRYPIISSYARTMMRKVGGVAVVCCIAFMIKAPAVYYINHSLCHTSLVTYQQYEIIWFCYMITVDIVPALLVLYIIRTPPSHTRNSLIGRSRDRGSSGSNGAVAVQPYHVAGGHISPLPSGFGHKESGANGNGADGGLPSSVSSSRFAEVDPLYISFGYYNVGTPPRSADRATDALYPGGSDGAAADLHALSDDYDDDEAGLLAANHAPRGSGSERLGPADQLHVAGRSLDDKPAFIL